MIDIHALSMAAFKALPLVTEGHSKEVRYAGGGRCVLRFKPTIHSYTHNRAGVVEGSERLRLEACALLVGALKRAGVPHAYREFSLERGFILADFVPQPQREGGPPVFRPDDIPLDGLPVAPPIEVLVKGRHVGSPKHLYLDMHRAPIRPGHPAAGQRVAVEARYPQPVVRFTWRNPLEDAQGRRLKDEEMCEDLAELFIDVAEARRTALQAWAVLTEVLAAKGVEPWDVCFFITSDGRTLFGEVSQDCGRFRPVDGEESLDKDVWRAGGSSGRVLEKWRQFLQAIR